MEVIPVINCPDAACAKKKIDVAKQFLHEGALLHIDAADGVFTKHKTWNEPSDWAKLRGAFNLEVHFMVQFPEEVLETWLAAGARRAIIQAESATHESLFEMEMTCKTHNAEMVISTKAEGLPEEILPFLGKFNRFQVLAVTPGASGQKFQPFILEKIRFIREHSVDAIIEVDGGMNPETARMVKEAGADIIVSSSYIFDSPDPKKAYEALRAI